MTPTMTLAKLADVSTPRKLNLGSGGAPIQGPYWTNVDCFEGPGVDLVHNLDVHPWPWDTATVDEIYCSHTLEHLRDHIGFMREAQRILRPGGHLFIRVPHGMCHAWAMDPTHMRPYFPDTFYMFTPGRERETRNPQHNHERWPDEFVIDEVREIVNGDLVNHWFWRKWIPKVKNHWFNVVTELWVYMHRLTPQEAQWIRSEVRVMTIPSSLMTQKDSIAAYPQCYWKTRTIEPDNQRGTHNHAG